MLGNVHKILIIIFLFILTGISPAQQYWLKQNSPTQKRLNDVHFLDSLTGWAAGDSGIILHTSNGGTKWSIQNSGIADYISSIYFINSNSGWATALRFTQTQYFTVLLYTTNGGLNWVNSQHNDTNQLYYDIYFLNNLTGWMGGENGKILKTTTSGTAWYETQTDSSIFSGFPIFDLEFYSSGYGFAMGGANDISGVIWRTIDGGENWSITGGSVLGSEPYFGMVFFDSLNINCVGGDFDFGSSIIRTTNGGLNWDYEVLGIFGFASALSFRTRAEGWSPLGFEKKFMYTLDSGNTWQTVFTPDSMEIYDVQFTDERNGYAVGRQGTILKYNSDLINIQNISGETPDVFRLKQNYPNPFNPSTRIEYEIKNAGHISLKLYNSLGKEILEIYEGFLTAGSYYSILDGTGLAAGVYYYRLEFLPSVSSLNKYTETKKLVFIK